MFILESFTLLGGSSLTDFALASLVGIVLGTYSSMFLASPLAIELERVNPGRAASQTTRRQSAPPSPVRR